jgi:hypothetical protein
MSELPASAKNSSLTRGYANDEEESKERDDDEGEKENTDTAPSPLESSPEEAEASVNDVPASAPGAEPPAEAPAGPGPRRTTRQKESDAAARQISAIYAAKGMKIGSAIARGAYYAELKAKERAMKNGKSEEDAKTDAEKVRNDYVSRKVSLAKTQRVRLPMRASRITTPKSVKEVISTLRNGIDDVLRNTEAQISLMMRPAAAPSIKEQAAQNLRKELHYTPPARLVNAFATTRASKSGAKVSNFLEAAKTAGIYKGRTKTRSSKRRSKN